MWSICCVLFRVDPLVIYIPDHNVSGLRAFSLGRVSFSWSAKHRHGPLKVKILLARNYIFFHSSFLLLGINISSQTVAAKPNNNITAASFQDQLHNSTELTNSSQKHSNIDISLHCAQQNIEKNINYQRTKSTSTNGNQQRKRRGKHRRLFSSLRRSKLK